jgi:DNA-binding transcriptional ArsR family regulator
MADLLPSIPDASAAEDAEPRVVGLGDDDADDVLGALASTTARELFAALNEDPAHPSALAERVDTSLQNVQYHLGNLEDAGVVEVVDTAYSEKGREMDVYAPADRPLVLFAGDEEEQSLLDRALGRLLGGVGVLGGASLVVRGLATAGGTGGGSGDGTEYDGRSGAAVPADNESYTESADDVATDGGGADGGGGTDGGGGADGGGGTDASGGDAGGGGSDSLDHDVGEDAAREGGEQAVEPLAQELAWLADPLDVGLLPPELLVFAIGACLLAVGVGAWYWRKRETSL